MITCTPDALADAAACFNAGYGPQVLKAIRIILLCKILNGETVSDCGDIEALAEEAKCFVDAMDLGTMDAVETYLTCAIASM